MKTKVKKDFIFGALLFVLGIGAMVLISDFGMKPTLWILAPLVGLMIPGAYFVLAFKSEQRLVKRDDLTLKALSGLSDRYTVLRNVYIPYKREILECHFVVVGDNGVFIVEANNSQGAIHESKDQRYWLNYRTGKNSRLFVRAIANQRALVDYKIVGLAKYLMRYGIHVYAQGIVYFPRKKSDVNLLNHRAVFDDPTELKNYITNFPPRLEVDELKKEKIEKLLKLDTILKR